MATLQFDRETLIPEILRAHPETREVFDRYGLKGCGGALGPPESLAFFARAHGVDEQMLLAEIGARIATGAPAAPGAGLSLAVPGIADTIYRPFFKAGIALTILFGVVWGVALLLRIGFGGSFGKVGTLEVNAHAHAQIFGWVGLFIMGFSYQAFSRFKHTDLFRPDLAMKTFYLMVAGIVMNAVAGPFSNRPAFLAAALAGSVAEIAAIGLFVWIMHRTFRTSTQPPASYDGYVASAFAWFLIQAVFSTFHLAATSLAPDETILAWRVKLFQPALRDLQIHGFAMMMILGVSQRFLPGMFALRKQDERLNRAMLWPLNLAIAGEALFYTLSAAHGTPLLTALRWAFAIAVPAAVALLTIPWGPFGRSIERDRSLKFVRASYAWLYIAMLMLALTPAYLGAADLDSSHAYAGAVRHAITVGFVSLMILGVAAKVVPTLAGIDHRQLSALWAPFLLVNLGCALRVVFQVLTDFWPFAFRIAGVSGLFELTGITIWGIQMWKLMTVSPGESIFANERPRRIEPGMAAGVVAELFPETLPVFESYGFGHMKNPILRRTLGRAVTLAKACEMHAHDIDRFVRELNRAIGAADPASLPPSPPAPEPIAAPSPPAAAVLATMTIAETVKKYPPTLRVFARAGMDACCGGMDTIANSAEFRRVDLDPLLAELNREASRANGNRT